jgi:competence transcription factor ComK
MSTFVRFTLAGRDAGQVLINMDHVTRIEETSNSTSQLTLIDDTTPVVNASISEIARLLQTHASTTSVVEGRVAFLSRH